MNRRTYPTLVLALTALAFLVAVREPGYAQPPAGGPKGFGGGKGPGGGKGAPPANLPSQPTAVTLPTLSAKITGPGAMFDTGKAHWTGRGPEFYHYDVDEYFVSGTANGKPYTTRLVIRKPADNAKFSGLVMTEPMHFSGNAHGFGYNSIYLMTSGHIAAEILTTSLNLLTAENPERYKSLQISNDQTNEVLAQIGALIRSKQGPLASLTVRKEVLWGTSASSAIVVNYLPAHAVYRTPEMARIYDGFLPTSNGSTIAATDVPLIQIPTQNEYRNIGTSRQDGDKPGEQYRDYEFAGMGHLDTRFDPRLVGACVHPLSQLPMEAYMSVALHRLFEWVDKGVVPPHAPRILIDRDTTNDGTMMAVDENGNPLGGIRSPYLDLATATYKASDQAAPGKTGDAPLLCGLSNYIVPYDAAKMKKLYKDPKSYVKRFEARLNELEKAGWSLPIYHDLLMEDARKVTF